MLLSGDAHQTVTASSTPLFPTAEAGKSKEKSLYSPDSLAAVTSVILQLLIYCYGLKYVPPEIHELKPYPPM